MFTLIRNKFHPLWRLRQLSWYRKLQKKVDFSVAVRNGRIRCQVMFLRDFALVVSNRGPEIETHALFEQIIKGLKISHLLDIGANVGSFSWHALDISPDLEVHLFEPDETNIRLLKKTIRRNKLQRVHLWSGVVSRETGDVEFLIDEASGATGSIGISPPEVSLQSEYGMKRTAKVSSTTLDAYTSPLELSAACILVKIDVEGAEGDVIDGGLNFFLKHRPIVIIECFERKKLDPLCAARYTAFDLPGEHNYIVVPEEHLPTLRERKISLGQKSNISR